ncbi:MAG TPA: hypothetical protein VMT63_08525 [Bacteroidales bacterium]|nr:hypothetical protein [Bacteroidales bacterium]
MQKTFTWKYPVNMQTQVKFDNYNCDLVIHTWEKSLAEYHLTIEATGKTQEDEERLVRYLEKYDFRHSEGEVAFGSSFWKNRMTFNGRTTLEIEGEKNIVLTDFTIKGELWIPAGCNFAFQSKYSKVDMENFSGKFQAELYNDHFHGGNVTTVTDLEAKYADIEFTELKGLNAELYNCTFNAESTGDLTLNSKYSKLRCKTAGAVAFDSYNDKAEIENSGDLRFSSKYSDLNMKVAGKVTLDCYNGNIEIGTSREIRLSSKYAEFRFAGTGDIKIGDTYNDKYYIGKASSMRIDVSKYSAYNIDELLTGLTLGDGYNDNISVQKTSESLKEFRVSGKYLEVSLRVPPSLSYRLTANIKYPEFDVNESAFKTRIKILENSELQYEGVKGTEKSDLPLIEIKGYEIKLKLTDIN